MKQKILIPLLLLLNHEFIYAQISNGSFEQNSISCCAGGNCGEITPFNDGNVVGWHASHGSPHLTKTGCSGFNGVVQGGDNAVFCDWMKADSVANHEGIFTDFNFKKGYTYTFTIWARKIISPKSKIVIKLVSGLSNDPNGLPNSTIPNPSHQQLIVEKELTTSFEQIVFENLTPNDDYSQLLIYSLDGSIIIDGVGGYQTCCEPFKVYQNITNPPTTYRNYTVKAGENIIDSLSEGKVIINKDAGFVIFQAGNEVELLPGFETEDNAYFEARIAPCSEVPMQVSLTKLIPEVDDYPCMRKLKAEACFGSGFLKIIWPDGMQGENGESILFSPKDHQSVVVKFVDLHRNDTIVKSVDFSNEPFFGDFHISFGNFVTANGDGINDIWVAGDDLHPDTTHFAYNAYSFYLEINNRWGQRVFDRYWVNKNDGFADKSIKWDDPDLCDNPDGTYFGLLDLRNCTNDEEDFISFTIALDCMNNLVQKLNNEKILNNLPMGDVITINIDSILLTNKELNIYPNPVTDILTLKYNSPKEAFLLIEIINSTGIVVKTLNSNFFKGTNIQMIGLQDLPKGIYTIKVITNENIYHEKVIKQ